MEVTTGSFLAPVGVGTLVVAVVQIQRQIQSERPTRVQGVIARAVQATITTVSRFQSQRQEATQPFQEIGARHTTVAPFAEGLTTLMRDGTILLGR